VSRFEALAPLLEAPERTAVLTDYDGTLAPVVDDPAAAVALPGTVEALHALTARFAVVAVVSGRPASFLLARLGPGLRLSGLYGLEEVADDGAVVAAAEAADWLPVVAATTERASAALGGLVEPKGLSLTLHFRTAPEREVEVRTWAAAEAAASGLVVRPAKASVELHPPVAADKGSVVVAAAEGLEAACFLGDDVGDLPAFDALDRLAAAGLRTVRIGVRTDEAPPSLLERCDLVVDGPQGALAVLRHLADAAG
jgi:trehalose 6-phosphate phosphatase